MKPADRTPADLAAALHARRPFTPADLDDLLARLRAAGLDLDLTTRQLSLYVPSATPHPSDR